jgi:hypothetical protein
MQVDLFIVQPVLSAFTTGSITGIAKENELINESIPNFFTDWFSFNSTWFFMRSATSTLVSIVVSPA